MTQTISISLCIFNTSIATLLTKLANNNISLNKNFFFQYYISDQVLNQTKTCLLIDLIIQRSSPSFNRSFHISAYFVNPIQPKQRIASVTNTPTPEFASTFSDMRSIAHAKLLIPLEIPFKYRTDTLIQIAPVLKRIMQTFKSQR